MTTPRRRWFRFPLRALLVLMLVAGIGSGVLVRERRRIADRRVGLLEAGFSTLSPSREQSPWKIFLLGDAWPANANDLGGCGRTNDAGLAYVRELTKLRTLYLDGSEITDLGMSNLTGLHELRELDLFGTRISDDGLFHLKQLTNLESLSIGETQVTDAGVAELQKALPNCRINR